MKGTYIHKQFSVLSNMRKQALDSGLKAKLTYHPNNNIYKLIVK